MKTKVVILLSLLLSTSPALFAQSTAFTYQGRLMNGGTSPNGLYEMNFALYDAVTNGNLVGTPVTVAPLPVSNGLFTVSLDFGGAAFAGANLWLEITVNVFGSDQPTTLLQPRQPLAPTPYALHAYNAAGLMSFTDAPLDIKVNGERALRLEPTAIPSPGAGRGAPNVIGGSPENSVVAGVSGATIGGGGATEWYDGGYANSVLGNFGTVSGGLGNTAGEASATVSGGFLNFSSGAESTVSGGQNNISSGRGATIGGGWLNRAGGDLATVGGGQENQVFDLAPHATIAGGMSNRIETNSPFSTISGGNLNVIEGSVRRSTIGGGEVNRVGYGANTATIGGGEHNTIIGPTGGTTIGGGEGNNASRRHGTIGGGANNSISPLTTLVPDDDNPGQDEQVTGDGAIVAGGYTNSVAGEASTVSGGAHNTATGDYATLAGGFFNLIQADPFNSYGVTLSGGTSNSINSSSYATVAGGSGNSMIYGFASTISGGVGNRMDPYSGGSVIGGGVGNVMEEFGGGATIAGGEGNQIGSAAAGGSIGGGRANRVGSLASYATVAGGNANGIGERAEAAVITGGDSNTIEDQAAHSSVVGGLFNVVKSNAQYAVITGGFDNLAGGQHSAAAGTRAQALHKGAFVWADYSSPEPNNPFGVFAFASTATNEFAVRATGGARLVSAIDSNGAPAAGVLLTPGSGSWSSLSDRNAKENITAVSGREILEQVAALPLATWNYKAQDKSVRHLGPMAQDFHDAFGLGESDRTITTVDADGVALAAIQGLNAKLEEQLKAKDARMAELERRLVEIENRLKR